MKILKPVIASDDVWFASDAETNNKTTLSYSQETSKLGTIDDVISLAALVDQFLSGVFLVVSKWDSPSNLQGEFFMDDEPFSDMQNAYIKIVAFDTSWFEIYAKDAYFLENLAEIFNCQVLTQPGL